MEEEKNKVGRPLKFTDSSEVEKLCEEYFEYIKGEYKEDEEEVEPELYKVRKEWIRNPEPPTVTGLTLFLGFADKSSLYDYAKKDEFSHSIKRALTKIEQYHEIATSMGDKCTGNIFVLKNFGWRDSNHVDHTTGGDKINTIPVIGMQILNEPETTDDTVQC